MRVTYNLREGLIKHRLLQNWQIIGGVLLLLAALTFGLHRVLADTVVTNANVVHPSDVRPIAEAVSGDPSWYRETTGTGTVNITNNRPYNGLGSAEFSVGDSGSYAELGLYNTLANRKLSEILNLSYATNQTVDNLKAVSLQIRPDFDVTDADTPWQGSMVYEPYINGTVVDTTWQTWQTLTPTAKWWMTWSAAATTKYGANPCPQSSPCTVSQILALFPNVGFNAGFGNPLVLKAGSGWASFTGFADVPAITYLNGITVTSDFWDFEPEPVTPPAPTDKDQCKKDGWKDFGTMFKNQGQCVSYVVTGGKKVQ